MEYVSLFALGQALAPDAKLRILRSGLLGMSKYNLFIVKDTGGHFEDGDGLTFLRGQARE
jgi:hypothetical protein